MKNHKLILITLLASVFTFKAVSQQHLSAMQAYDKAQQDRSDANDLWEKKDPSPAELNRSIGILKHTLVFLDSLPIKELANGNFYLKARAYDVYLDMAQSYTVAGKKDSAIMALENRFALSGSSYPIDNMDNFPLLAPLAQEPRYLAIMDQMKRQKALWQNEAFKTSYKDNLTDAEKVAGLSLLWSQAKYNFVNFVHAGIDWNQTYLDYLPKVTATKTTADYYKVLISFYALLKDGHTNVYFPDALAGQFYSRPPFRTQLIEGRVFVTQVFSDSLFKTGIQPGLELLKIDGEPVIDYAEKNVKPYQSSSTPQDLEIREFSYALLAGAKDKPLNIEFKTTKGKVISKTIARTGYHDVKGLKTLEYKTINNVGYLTINNFEDNSIAKQFDSLYTAEIAKTRGLIIDIRYNGGGSSGIGYNIINRLTDKPFKTSAAKFITLASRPGAEPAWTDMGFGEWSPNKKIFYDKPVVVLIGPRTFSAAEDFTVAFDYMKRGKLIGMPTGGSTGQPVSFNLPGGGVARVCGKHDTYADGKEFVGIGINPDIIVKPTIKDLLNGVDAAKEKALQLLQ
ncbi:Tricorn protease C1 domain-containing protein [Mucilaginibacter gossypiicola]|uniref:Tricorn protease C1 domain-containing protein n=1 Tax=Mucilaginibacter gossypiicola TaxID=551995 RepID=A0A1H8QRZ8_9SPHI|nr:S41 family peptidase [Mucilaginibacter gossypiicola]SEO57040.1 Tricorn protease C1 domain-containing protein [Mucilaginibacter gossypiicola]